MKFWTYVHRDHAMTTSTKEVAAISRATAELESLHFSGHVLWNTRTFAAVYLGLLHLLEKCWRSATNLPCSRLNQVKQGLCHRLGNEKSVGELFKAGYFAVSHLPNMDNAGGHGFSGFFMPC